MVLCMAPSAARVVAAINEPVGAIDALTFETFVFSDPGDAGRPDCPKCKDDWYAVHFFVYFLSHQMTIGIPTET